MSATTLITSSHNVTRADAGRRSHLMSSRHMNHCRLADSWRMTSIRAQQSIRTMVVTVWSSVDPVPHLPSNRSPSPWKFWVLGVFVSVILPFWRNKWGPLWQLKNEFEAVVETTEHVTEIVEEGAEKIEQVAKKVAEHLPDGELKDWLNKVESGAEVIDKTAHNFRDFIHEVEEVEKAVESFMEPDKINNQAGEISKGTDEQNQKS